jgi:hypothetical protein
VARRSPPHRAPVAEDPHEHERSGAINVDMTPFISPSVAVTG